MDDHQAEFALAMDFEAGRLRYIGVIYATYAYAEGDRGDAPETDTTRSSCVTIRHLHTRAPRSHRRFTRLGLRPNSLNRLSIPLLHSVYRHDVCACPLSLGRMGKALEWSARDGGYADRCATVRCDSHRSYVPRGAARRPPGCDEREGDVTTRAGDPARCPQLKGDRGMSNHNVSEYGPRREMVLDGDVGGGERKRRVA